MEMRSENSGRAQFYSVIKKRQEVSTKTERERVRVPGIIQYICDVNASLLYEYVEKCNSLVSPRIPLLEVALLLK
ncbi:hypothetical protein N7501_007540 [Penicillium viridicatum]|nr:hypothetical protein N7501_007540 [Penicillium viridicatum]